jgi:succinate dehydrogenase/fumarate reductase cytochrome b subunit
LSIARLDARNDTKGIIVGVQTGGFFGLVLLALNVWAIISIVSSPATTGTKVLWVVIILLLPLLGFVLWLLAGPKER